MMMTRTWSWPHCSCHLLLLLVALQELQPMVTVALMMLWLAPQAVQVAVRGS
jgi:hypothetical protein